MTNDECIQFVIRASSFVNHTCGIVRRHSDSALAVHAVFDVLDGLADGLDLLGGVIGDVDIELFFEFHDELDGIERIGAEIVYEGRFRRDLFSIDAQVVGDDIFYSFHY